MTLDIAIIIKVTFGNTALTSLPVYTITFNFNNSMLSLAHQFDYHPETFDESDLQTYNERVLIINEICKSAKSYEKEESPFGMTTETWLF
jgi:hypothetical protein